MAEVAAMLDCWVDVAVMVECGVAEVVGIEDSQAAELEAMLD